MERRYILGLMSQLSGPTYYKLLVGLGCSEAVWHANARELGFYGGITGARLASFLDFRDRVDLEQLEQQVLAQGIQFVTRVDNSYPRRLQAMVQPPPLLFFKGREELFNSFSLGVVGTRYPTSYGKLACVKLVGELARKGITIVSGMARGIDGLAHQEALAQAGGTIAVLGTGLDICYPREHLKLFQNISEQGLLVSEYFPGKGPAKWHFPARNRIIAGLSQGILLIEARAKSGSLITVQQALENGREVFCLPGDIFRPESYGGNRLLQQGAKLVLDVSSILEEFPSQAWSNQSMEKSEFGDRGKPEQSVLAYIGHEPVDVDYILAQSRLSPSTLLTQLTVLEIEGKIVRLPGQRFVRSPEQLSLNLGS